MVRDPARPASFGSGSSMRVAGFRLRHRGREIPLESGQYTIGRAEGCDVQLEDPHVSRLHARLLVNDTTALLEDLRSEHGVFVNEQRIRRSVRLNDGDRILIGAQEIVFIVGPVDSDNPRSSGTVEIAASTPIDWQATRKMMDGALSTLEADAFQYLGNIAEKMIGSERGATAERLLRGHLEEVLSVARSSGNVPREVVDAAAVNAVRLAFGLRKAGWLDYAIELHFVLRVPPCSAVTSGLRVLLRQLPGCDWERLGEYENVLKALMPSMDPDDLARARAFMWTEK